MKKIAVSGIIVLILVSMSISPLGTSLVKAVGDPIISGIVQDKLQNPIPDIRVSGMHACTAILFDLSYDSRVAVLSGAFH